VAGFADAERCGVFFCVAKKDGPFAREFDREGDEQHERRAHKDQK
jgi:hypothetical protein